MLEESWLPRELEDDRGCPFMGSHREFELSGLAATETTGVKYTD